MVVLTCNLGSDGRCFAATDTMRMTSAASDPAMQWTAKAVHSDPKRDVDPELSEAVCSLVGIGRLGITVLLS